MTKQTKTTRKNVAAANKAIASAAKPNAKAKAAPKTPATFTTVELAARVSMQPKTLRARIRRNIDDWAPLFVDGTRHVFADNKTTMKRAEALLA